MSDSPPRLNLIQRAIEQAQARSNKGAAQPQSEADGPKQPAVTPAVPLSAAVPNVASESTPSAGVSKEQVEKAKRPVIGEVALNYARLREAKISLPGDRNSTNSEASSENFFR
jgi:hypothetical protein